MKKTKKGFTLVELVIVVAVMAVLVAVAIPTVSSIVNSAQESVNDTNAQTIESMIKLEQAKKKSGVALGEGEIVKAIVDAKLGIETGYFMYNTKTGECAVSDKDATAGTNELKIVFDKDNEKVTVGSSSLKLDGSAVPTSVPTSTPDPSASPNV